MKLIILGLHALEINAQIMQMPKGAFIGTILPPSRAGRVHLYAVMHDRRFHSSLRTKLVVRGGVVLHHASLYFCTACGLPPYRAQAHCVKKD